MIQEQEHLIELKYKPTNLELEINGSFFEIKHQGAQDLYCYDFWSDVHKLERIGESSPAVKGYVIFLTNDIRYWIGSEDTDADYYPFRLNDKREVTGHMMWQNNVERKGDTRQSPIGLSGKYRIQWTNYSDVKHLQPKPPDHALYKYLLISV